jgi:glucose-1-phosphate adenylyltransferase
MFMKEVMGVINLVNEPGNLEELTYERAVASVPFGGRYRLIDFMLSSMVNSGIRNVAVFTHTKYRSLMDHIGSGKEWDLARKRTGLFVLPPAVEEHTEMLKGDLYYFHKHRDYFYRSPQEYIVISRSHMVCNIDLSQVIKYHKESKADVTVVYKEDDDQNHAVCRRLRVSGDGRVSAMYEHFSKTDSNKVSMEIYVMQKDLLLDLVETSLASGYDHFVRNAIMKNMDRLTIYGYAYKGYLGVVNTINSYYQHSLNMLNPDVWQELFSKPGTIYTKVKDEAPTKYTPNAVVRNSLIANGCVIDGTVENCILFRGVKVAQGAYLKNCIIMQNGYIAERAEIENAILDKDVVIHNDVKLKGDPKAPFIAAKKKII